MKNLIKLGYIVCFLSVFSCTNEPLDPALEVPVNQINPNCLTPQYLQLTPIVNGSTTVTWNQAGSESTWQIQYGVHGFDLGAGTTTIATSTSKIITGLNPALSYDFYIQSVCGNQEYGGWSSPFTLQAPASSTCNAPSVFTAIRNSQTNTSVQVSFIAGGSEASWDVQYGAPGFTVGQGTNTVSTTTSITITNLATTAYDFYVRAKCSDTDFSSWVGPVNVSAVGVVNPTGDYWPMTVNNSWTFKKDGVLQAPMKIISTETINNLLYYKYENFFGLSTLGSGFTATAWTRKANGSYYYRVNATSATFTVSFPDVIILKDNLSVNQTWNESFVQTSTVSGITTTSPVTTVGKILETNTSLTVNGVTYNNVIKSELIKTTDVGGGVSQVDKNTYWFAKDFGPIKIINEYSGTTTTQELNSVLIN